jgi:16S rRNA U1498 N3-methylase RsmE
VRLHRFLGDYNLDKKLVRISERDVLNQLLNVFRFDIDDKFVLCDGQENEAIVKIVNSSKRMIEVEIVERFKNKDEPEAQVTLFCSF